MVKKGIVYKGIVALSAVTLVGALAVGTSQPNANIEGDSSQGFVAIANAKTVADEEATDNANNTEKPKKGTVVNKAKERKAAEEAAAKAGTSKNADTTSNTTKDKTGTKATTKDDKTSSDTKAASSWTLDMDCAVCHTVEGESMEDDATAACFHAKEVEDITCGSCHTDEETLADVHTKAKASAKPPKKLKKTTIETEACLNESCHDLTTDELADLTKNITDCTDSKGTTVNPHEVMGLTPGHGNITCGNCHKMHSDGEIDAANTCVSCHHAGVYECNTCH